MTPSTNAHAVLEPEEARIDESDGLFKLLQKYVYAHYVAAAYILILGSYFCAFGLYLFLRLASLLLPDKLVHMTNCQRHANETVNRTGVHYASVLVSCSAIGIFQVICFFLLTISGNFLHIRRRFTHFISMEEKMLLEQRYRIRKIMFSSLVPTFVVYCMSSGVVLSSIFYMTGLRDEEVDTTSHVFVYLFDAFILLYFLAFPVVSVGFHPDVQCSLTKCLASVPPASARLPPLPLAASASHLIPDKTSSGGRSNFRRARITTTV